MRLHRGLWAGACLLLALAGCSDKPKVIEGSGTYSPIITGISSSNEPAARDTTNLLTAQVTNVNNLALTYHWSAAAGTITDTTNATATWKAPNAVGFYDVTVSIEAQDGDIHYFRTMTVRMAVDNLYTRWTQSETAKFDEAPVPGGGVLFSEFRNTSIGSSDIFRVDAPLDPPIQLTTGFFSATSASARADRVDFAFTGKLQQSDGGQSLYLLPMGGGNQSTARVVERRSNKQTYLGSPRFDRAGTRLAYASDSMNANFYGSLVSLESRDAAFLGIGPVQMLSDAAIFNRFTNLPHPTWGPDIDADGDADSVMSIGYDFFGTSVQSVSGIYVVPALAGGNAQEDVLWLSGVNIEPPDWSPDGQYVVFARKNVGTNERDIWIIRRANASINGAIRVTSGPADDSQPRFGADSNTIFFLSNRVDHYGLNGIYGTERRGTNIWSVAHFDKP